jgi:drug/metabolite transporter (DMT)-like permease
LNEPIAADSGATPVPRLINLALLILPAAIWASLVVVGAEVMLDVQPVSLACITWAVAAVALLCWTHRTLIPFAAVMRREWALLLLCALTGIAAFQGFWFAGLVRANATNVAILTATLPVMIAALAAVTLKERLRPWQLVGVALTILGTLWVGVSGDVTQLSRLHLGKGEVLILIANLCMSVYTIALKRWPSQLPPLTFMAVVATVGSLMLLPGMFIEGGIGVGWEPYVKHMSAIAYIGVISGAAAYAFWNESVVRNGANVTALCLYTQPSFAIVFCWVFLKQPLMAYHWQGLVPIVAGVVLVVLAESPPREAMTGN